MKCLNSILNSEQKTQTLGLEKLIEDQKTSAPQVLEMGHEQKVQVVEEGILEMVFEESKSESDVETVQEVKAQDPGTKLNSALWFGNIVV